MRAVILQVRLHVLRAHGHPAIQGAGHGAQGARRVDMGKGAAPRHARTAPQRAVHGPLRAQLGLVPRLLPRLQELDRAPRVAAFHVPATSAIYSTCVRVTMKIKIGSMGFVKKGEKLAWYK